MKVSTRRVLPGTIAQLRESAALWLEQVVPGRTQLVALAAAGVVFGAIALVVWVSLPAPAARIMPSAVVQPAATRVPATTLPLRTFALSTPAVVVAPSSATSFVSASEPEGALAPTESTDGPTAAPIVPAEPSGEELAWSMLQPELDAVWDRDTKQAITLLSSFLADAPDHAVAREKLYAALLSEADRLAAEDQPQQAVADLARAQQLQPTRDEAAAALLALTPQPLTEPSPEPTPRPIPPAAPARVQAAVITAPPARSVPVPAPPPAQAVSPPTPTKVPFGP